MSRKQSTGIRIVLWTSSICVILLVGVLYFPKEDSNLDFWGSLYYTINLFVLGHYLSGFPKTWPLIAIYFAAPALSLSAAGTAIKYLFRHTPSMRTRWMSDHVVICGVGRTGKILAGALKEKGIKVVGVDVGPIDKFEEWVSSSKVPMIYGDFMSRVVLARAGAEKAMSIYFASGDDLLNLEGVVAAYEWLHNEPGKLRCLWAHVANENLASTVTRTFDTSGRANMKIFDTYHIAAEEMVHNHFTTQMREGISKILLLGFGKFGRDLFEVLVTDLRDHGETPDFEVLDKRDLGKDVHMLAKELVFKGRVSFRQADINSLSLRSNVSKAFFLCTDDDIGNLSAALTLADRTQRTQIFVRMAKWPMPAIDSALHEGMGITFENINELVEDRLIELIESDTYQIAADEMVQNCFNAEKRKGISHILLLGFGRFGSDLFEMLLKDLKDRETLSFEIFDNRDHASDVCNLATKYKFANHVSFKQADVGHLELHADAGKAFFVCCDNDSVNLSTALRLAKTAQGGKIFFRMACWPMPALRKQICREVGITKAKIKTLVKTKVVTLLEIIISRTHVL